MQINPDLHVLLGYIHKYANCWMKREPTSVIWKTLLTLGITFEKEVKKSKSVEISEINRMKGYKIMSKEKGFKGSRLLKYSGCIWPSKKQNLCHRLLRGFYQREMKRERDCGLVLGRLNNPASLKIDSTAKDHVPLMKGTEAWVGWIFSQNTTSISGYYNAIPGISI